MEASPETLYSDRTDFRPTTRQKNAATSVTDLINRLAIPQLGVSDGNSISTLSQRPVSIFIDYLPIQQSEYSGLRLQDVLKVEFYENPTDPRFKGAEYVLNLIMQKYEYGGYTKASASSRFITPYGYAGLYSKMAYKKLTYDVSGGTSFDNNFHTGANDTETYRLPQDNNEIKTFKRIYNTDNSHQRSNEYWASARANYATEKIQIQNTIGGTFNQLRSRYSGNVNFSPAEYASTEFFSSNRNFDNSFSYNGNFWFALPKGNTISFMPSYSFTHTNSTSLYKQADSKDYINDALDNTKILSLDFFYTKDFGKSGQLVFTTKTKSTFTSTDYSGNSTIFNSGETYNVQPRLRYTFKNKKVNVSVFAGMIWDKVRYEDAKHSVFTPAFSTSFRYVINSKNSIRASYDFGNWAPSLNFLSTNVIQSNPLFYYTGNPALKPFDDHSISVGYSFVPSKKFSLSASGFAWIIGNRYVYDYRPEGDHILRTIIQPGGSYWQAQYSFSATLRLLDNNLILRANGRHYFAHNGYPFNWTKNCFTYGLQGWYYLGNFNFYANYSSPYAYADGCMVGYMFHQRSSYSIGAGWSNSSWNLYIRLKNFARWHWNSDRLDMTSEYYDSYLSRISTRDHANITFTVSYSIGYGKKISRNNEVRQQSGAGNAILK